MHNKLDSYWQQFEWQLKTNIVSKNILQWTKHNLADWQMHYKDEQK